MHLRGRMLAEGGNYHVYNRGAHKQDIFSTKDDYDRFQILLHLLNSRYPVVLRDVLPSYKGRSHSKIFLEEHVDHSLVDILAYSLMPNHFHLVLRQKSEAGISQFMRKLCTAYSMYFNTKYDHSGVVFQGRYKAKHIGNEAYFRYLFAYVHLNPIELSQSDWKKAGMRNPAKVKAFLSDYRYSSYYDYCVLDRPERAILCQNDIAQFVTDQNDLEDLIKWESKGETTRDEIL
jgi:REP-associated tyrosine transposase